MPSGRTHDRITLWTLPAIVGLTTLSTRNSTVTLLVAGGYLFSGLMFGPDLDIYSVQFKRWGWLRGLWIPYQRSMRHRSRLSHGFLLGTILRLCYLLGILGLGIGLVILLGQAFFNLDWHWGERAIALGIWLRNHRIGLIALFIGLELGAMSHAIADWTGSCYKRWQRNRAKAKGRRGKAKSFK
ncbi:MAG: metal-binding protein [Spirulina sp. DLM2.Bin59]|nr:MAG: metal-binding protein [Spirulina sp. DLM2.Bin59]